MDVKENAVEAGAIAKAAPETGPKALERFWRALHNPLILLPLCVLILYFRTPDRFYYPQFFWEDGSQYFKGARELGWRFFFVSFTNYPLTANRIVAYATSFFTELYAPWVYNYFALTMHLAVALALLSPRVPLRFRPLLVLLVMMTPCYQNEVFMNMTNTQWWVAILIALLAISEDAVTRWQKAGDIAALLVLGVSGPIVVVFYPLFVYRYAVRRSAYSGLLLVIATALTVFLIFLAVTLPEQTGRSNLPLVINSIWLGVFGDSILGVMLLGVTAPVYFENSVVLTVLSVALVIGVAVRAAVKRDHAALMLVAAAVLALLAASYSFRYKPEYVIQSPRYHFLFRALFVLALVQCLADGRWIAVPAGLLIGWSALTAVPGLQGDPFADYKWASVGYRLSNSPGRVMIPISTIHMMVLENPPERTGAQISAESLGRGTPLAVLSATSKPVVLRLAKPLDTAGVRIRYRVKTVAPKCALKLQWIVSVDPDGPKGQRELSLETDGAEHFYTVQIGGFCDLLALRVEAAGCEVEILEVWRLY